MHFLTKGHFNCERPALVNLLGVDIVLFVSPLNNWAWMSPSIFVPTNDLRSAGAGLGPNLYKCTEEVPRSLFGFLICGTQFHLYLRCFWCLKFEILIIVPPFKFDLSDWFVWLQLIFHHHLVFCGFFLLLSVIESIASLFFSKSVVLPAWKCIIVVFSLYHYNYVMSHPQSIDILRIWWNSHLNLLCSTIR